MASNRRGEHGENLIAKNVAEKKSAEIVVPSKFQITIRNCILEVMLGNCGRKTACLNTCSIPLCSLRFLSHVHGFKDTMSRLVRPSEAAEVLVYNSSYMMWIELLDL